jgi:hypothetical protein
MKSSILFFTVIVITLSSGCGSTSTNSNSNANGDVAVVNANPPANSNIVPYVPPGAEALNANAAGNVTVTNPAPTPNAKYMTYPAPDNSEYSTIMDANGLPVETRVFKSDPQISKVVRTWLGVKEKKISIYLKNGKVVNVAGDKMEDIKTVPVTTFYDAAGIKQATAPPAPGKKPAAQ